MRAAEEPESSCAAVCNCRLDPPERTRPCHARTSRTSSCHVRSPKRAAGSLLRSSVLPSAAITSPRPTSPVRSLPIQAMPSLLSLRAAERAKALSAAVCNCYLTRTCRTFPDRTTPHQAGTRPSLPSRNLPRPLSKRAAERACALSAAVCNRSLASPDPTGPCHNTPNRSLPRLICSP